VDLTGGAGPKRLGAAAAEVGEECGASGASPICTSRWASCWTLAVAGCPMPRAVFLDLDETTHLCGDIACPLAVHYEQRLRACPICRTLPTHSSTLGRPQPLAGRSATRPRCESRPARRLLHRASRSGSSSRIEDLQRCRAVRGHCCAKDAGGGDDLRRMVPFRRRDEWVADADARARFSAQNAARGRHGELLGLLIAAGPAASRDRRPAY
jgi:hypothetical protein